MIEIKEVKPKEYLEVPLGPSKIEVSIINSLGLDDLHELTKLAEENELILFEEDLVMPIEKFILVLTFLKKPRDKNQVQP